MKPSKQISSHAMHDDRPKKKPAKRPFEEDDDEDGELAIGMIRKMFRYGLLFLSSYRSVI